MGKTTMADITETRLEIEAIARSSESDELVFISQQASSVVVIVRAYQHWRDNLDELSVREQRALLNCARLIIANSWYDLVAEATETEQELSALLQQVT